MFYLVRGDALELKRGLVIRAAAMAYGAKEQHAGEQEARRYVRPASECSHENSRPNGRRSPQHTLSWR